MSRMTPKVSITSKTVDAAVKRAVDGQEGEILDAACKGLALRLRGGAVLQRRAISASPRIALTGDIHY
jgi:hypothetical protein